MAQRTHIPIAERCKQVLAFIESYQLDHNKPPSLQEIADGTGIKSRGGQIYPIINKLIEDGRLERDPGVSRGIRLPNNSLLSIPMKGIIAANNRNPEIVMDEDPHATFELLRELIPTKIDRSKIYALKVNGDSMKDAMIADGDTVLMKQGDEWHEGDIVAVWLSKEGAVTLKKIYQGRPGIIKLKPKNPKHQTRVEKQEDIKVLGRIVSVIRKYN